MTDEASTATIVLRKRKPLWGRVLRATLYVKLALALILGIASGLVYMRLSAGPVNLQGFAGQVANALADRIGPGWTVRMRDTAVELSGWTPALRATGIDIRNPDGVLVVRAPTAIVSLDPLSLTTGNLALRSIDLQELQLRASIADDGSLSLVPPSEADDTVPRPADRAAEPALRTTAPVNADGEGAPPSRLSAAVASLFDLAFESTSIVGALDTGRITGAKLTLVGSDGRERVAFSRVDAAFERLGDKRRRFSLDLEGPRGAWRLGGDVGTADRGGTRIGALRISDLPVHDLLLLSGLSRLPGAADLKLSGEISANLVGGRLSLLQGSLRSSAGTITVEDPDTPPIRVDAATADASWDEDKRALGLSALTFAGGETRIRLEGQLAPSATGDGWDLALSGRDLVVSGAGDRDRPFTIERAEAGLRLADGGLLVDHLAFTGPGIGMTVSGSYGTATLQGGLRAAVDARATDARRLLRLWPDALGSDVRSYLIAQTSGGTVDRLALTAALSAAEVKDGLRKLPIPDKSLEAEFSLSGASLTPIDGLPVIQNGAASGLVTGRSASIRVGPAQIQHGGRVMAVSDASFRMKNTPDGQARIGFRIQGGADAMAGLMQAPLIRQAAALDMDPNAVKGRVDLRVDLPLSLKANASVADIPVVATGTLSDVAVEKAFGRDRLEAQSLALTYDRSGFSVRGDARLGGLPAAIEVRQPKDGAGEAVVSMVLDEAARTRRGLGFGGLVNGPVSLRASTALTRSERTPTFIEVDFTKASIDNLVPGWVKAAGKPGTATFTLRDSETLTEIGDLVLDSAPVQIRGSVSLGMNGNDKADFSTFKLSPGDELKVQGERSGGLLKVVARGNVADARAILARLTAPATKSGGRPGVDLDLDLTTNILAGFNDEALTGAVVKLSLRNTELRQLQLNGKFRAQPVSAQMVRRDSGPPVLVLRSGDAGATLRFVDLYRRMIGGTLNLQASLEASSQTGGVEIDSFELRNEPALKSIISQQPSGPGAEERGAAQLAQVNVDEVHFTKLRSDFTRTPARVDIRDAVIWGPQVGFKLAGYLDQGRDRTDISGTFVPAYGLNNVFSQVPLFGMILGGGQNEGLFAINFRIQGAPSAPSLIVNPLSAVAPGIFRKLFGTGGPGDTTGATSPLLPER